MRYNGWVINRTKDVHPKYVHLARKYLGELKEHRDTFDLDVDFLTRKETDGTIIKVSWIYGQPIIDIIQPKGQGIPPKYWVPPEEEEEDEEEDEGTCSLYVESGIIDLSAATGKVWFAGDVSGQFQKDLEWTVEDDVHDIDSGITAQEHQEDGFDSESLSHASVYTNPNFVEPSIATGLMRKMRQCWVSSKPSYVPASKHTIYSTEGVIRDGEDYYYAVVGINSIDIHEFNYTLCGSALKDYMNINYSLGSDQYNALEAYVFSQMTPGEKKHSLYFDGVSELGDPFYYGWKFSEEGKKIAVILKRPKPGLDPNHDALFRYESYKVELEINSELSDVDVSIDGPHEFLNFYQEMYIWYPVEFGECGMTYFQPFPGPFVPSRFQYDAPVYCWYKGEELTEIWMKDNSRIVGNGEDIGTTVGCGPGEVQLQENSTSTWYYDYGFYVKGDLAIDYVDQTITNNGMGWDNVSHGGTSKTDWIKDTGVADCSDCPSSEPCSPGGCVPAPSSVNWYRKVSALGKYVTYTQDQAEDHRQSLIIPYDDSEAAYIGRYRYEYASFSGTTYQMTGGQLILSSDQAKYCNNLSHGSPEVPHPDELACASYDVPHQWNCNFAGQSIEWNCVYGGNGTVTSETGTLRITKLDISAFGTEKHDVYSDHKYAGTGDYNTMYDIKLPDGGTSGRLDWYGWYGYFIATLTDPCSYSEVHYKESHEDNIVFCYKGPDLGYEYTSEGGNLIDKISNSFVYGGRI